jgi:enediyne polyketide synthase
LGEEGCTLARLIAEEAGESLEVAATRIWGARECIKKAGLPIPSTLTLLRQEGPLVWLQTHSAPARQAGRPIFVATWALTTQEIPDPLVISILAAAAPVQSPTPAR